MRHLASVISDFKIACLETDRVSFYAHLGWEVWRRPLAGRRASELLPTPDQKGIMILRLARTPPLDLDSLLVIEYREAMQAKQPAASPRFSWAGSTQHQAQESP